MTRDGDTGDLRRAVVELVALGRLPTDAQADAQPVRADRREALVGALHAHGPVTDAEAAALCGLFPADESDSYGVAWTLVHVVESAPGWPPATLLDLLDRLDRLGRLGRLDRLDRLDGPWSDVLRRRVAGPADEQR